MRTPCLVVTFCAVLSGLSMPVVSAAQDLPFKQVAAPPEDILSGRVRLPDPTACTTSSRAEMIPIELAAHAPGEWIFEAPLRIASVGRASVAILSPGWPDAEITVRTPSGAFAPIAQAFGVAPLERRTQALDFELPGWSIDRRDVETTAVVDTLVRVTVRGAARPAPGWLIVRDALPFGLAARTSTLATLSENEIGIVAHLYDAERADATQVAPHVARGGTVVVETSSGTQHLELHDDGLHADGAARDGVFGALLPRWTTGAVRARVEMNGLTSSGRPFARSVQLDFPVLERRTALSGNVDARIEDSIRLRIELGALALGPVSQLHVSAEVFGTDASGELVPVCWLSRMLVPEVGDGEWKMPLFLDGRWIARARVSAPFVLHAVRVQDPDTHVPYDVVDWLAVPPTALPPSSIAGTTRQRITTAMLMAPATSSAMLVAPPTPPVPLGGPSGSLVPSPLAHMLLLVHGYCSGGSIWPAADFAQPKQEFLDPSQNRTHDQFAQLLRQAVVGRKSFGIVGHSQGGPAALHLLTYYISGLDYSVGARRIQSLASPYQGTPLASLGAFSCGVNTDMTPTGSTMWLAGIPTWARNEVYYWTTSDGGSACNFFTGLLLSNPEDGTVEQFRGQLPGGHSMGHVTSWCHTTGMTYPASYTDHARNADMNTNAAR